MAEMDIYELGRSVVVFLGTWGLNGVLRWGDDGAWEFYPTGSRAWDEFHQEVYRNHKGDELTMADLASRGIPAPEAEKYAPAPGMEWKNNFAAEALFADAPRALRDDLIKHRGEIMDAYVVLLEDYYETCFGDGKFLYPEAAYWTRAAAEDYVKRKERNEKDPAKREWYRYSVKMVALRVDETGQRVTADLNIESYEHYSIGDLLRLLGKRYGGKKTR